MSFDLHFCSGNSKRIDFGTLAKWISERGPFTGNPDQLWYHNETTGVYFSLDIEADESATPDDSPIPRGYFDSGLSFNLNFNRPSFFGYEAMPFVEAIAKQFGLWVFNPQADQIEKEVREGTLVESWLYHNERAIRTLAQQGAEFAEPLHLPIEDSLYMWRFNHAKQILEQTVGDELYVPRLTPVRRRDAKKLGRAFTCTQTVPTVIPASEWVFLVRGKKGIFRVKKKPDVGIVSRETFNEVFRAYISDLEYEGLQLKCIRPEAIEKFTQLIASFERMLPRAELEIIGMDAFIDLDPKTLSA